MPLPIITNKFRTSDLEKIGLAKEEIDHFEQGPIISSNEG
jgi:hypothetical protein